MEVHQPPTFPHGVEGDFGPLHSPLNDVSVQSSSRPSASTARSSESNGRSKFTGTGSHRGSHESKPRLSKDQHERLEREFRNNRKPSTAVKRQFSQQLGISLEKVNNWFQNRRAKVKHEEKKQRGSVSAWPTDLPSGVPLSEYGFLNDAFLQTQDSLHVSQGAQFPAFTQSGFNADLPVAYSNGSGVGDCPTIHEEPQGPDDSNALMSFMGIDPQDGGHIQLQDVSHISRQFNAGGDSYPARAPYSPSFPPTPQVEEGASFVPSISGSTLVQSRGDDQTQTALPHIDVRHQSSTAAPPGAGPETSAFVTSLSGHQHPSQSGALEGTNFGIEDARHVFDQMQAQASQPERQSMEPHIFAPSANPPHVVMPQPILPSHPLSMEPPSQDTSRENSIWPGQHHLDSHSDIDTSQALSRTDSGTSMLAESMGGVQIDSVQPHLMRPPSQATSLTLAQRRQKRPAHLSPTGARSFSSSQAPLSASERLHNNANLADSHLRRIKSSTGVLNGRIQKPSGQRSPLHQSHFLEMQSHVPRQLSTSSIGAAVHGDEQGDSSNPMPPPPPSATIHGHQPSNGSGMTHLTIPEDSSQTADSVWSGMPSTADTTTTSLYYSVPQTANTVKSYASPPQTPMDHTQFSGMQIHPTGLARASTDGFMHTHHQAIQPHFAPLGPPPGAPPPFGLGMGHGPAGPLHISTDDLVMNSIPMGYGSAEQQPASAPVGVPMHHDFHMNAVPPGMAPQHQPGLFEHAQPHHVVMEPGQTQLGTPDMSQADISSQQHQQFVWNLQPSQQADPGHNQDLQIHQFTPSNPVDPSHLPPKQNKASPRQTYSFQNFGPDHYSSPKSQSSQSKASTPGLQQIGS
ncbi:MAG: hypothetical protein Q9159_007746 [Coniocarpon cinnabarinum]